MSATTLSEFSVRTGWTEEEIRLELACAAYRDQRLSFGKARNFAGLNHLEFQRALGARKIPRNYGIEELKEDLATIERIKDEPWVL
ncbi:UPF0175 family protein [Neolewinella antarctica]|uniref:HTH domain antitoxin n=1 Tax=Neolewinella antarctica TaxID=442734 RepID=A0ABX0XB56_9BACT|nr:UPF0175 family protein [Neolewinella antarctica]NJC26437.1 putative HTH domain antitoxin [Neolewinella antarctica]